MRVAAIHGIRDPRRSSVLQEVQKTVSTFSAIRGEAMRKRIITVFICSIALIMLLTGVILYQRKKQDMGYAKKLISAIEKNDMDLLSELLEEKGNVNAKPHFFDMDVRNYQPLSEAAYRGNFEAVKMLIEAGAKVNVFGTEKRTPLHMAVEGYSQENVCKIVSYLVEHGAKINQKNLYGEMPLATLLKYSMNEDRYQCFLYLVEHGADVYKGRHGSVLFEASYSNNVQVLSYLFSNYAIDPNERDISKAGYTPLIETTHLGAEDACKFLLAHGADKSLTDANGKTAYDYAIENGYTELAELLKP